MSFDISIQHRLGDCLIDLQIMTEARVVAICGPSGVGKTTALNVIAGLIKPDHATIRVGGVVLTDTARHINLPPEQRGAGYVFQDSRLFPNMSVIKNLTFGSKRADASRPPLVFDEIVALLGIEKLFDRSPKALSGGETRRVAIGRALLSSPNFLLLDEPMTSIDPARREELIEMLVRIRDEVAIPILYVSHTSDDVAKIAQEVVNLGT